MFQGPPAIEVCGCCRKQVRYGQRKDTSRTGLWPETCGGSLATPLTPHILRIPADPCDEPLHETKHCGRAGILPLGKEDAHSVQQGVAHQCLTLNIFRHPRCRHEAHAWAALGWVGMGWGSQRLVVHREGVNPGAVGIQDISCILTFRFSVVQLDCLRQTVLTWCHLDWHWGFTDNPQITLHASCRGARQREQMAARCSF